MLYIRCNKVNIRIQIPDFIVVTPASVNDVNGMDYIEYQTGSYYIFDRGYNDFARLYNIHTRKAFFIFRACEKIIFRRIYSIKKEPDTGIKSDQTGVFNTGNSPKRYPEKIRRIRCYDAEQNRAFIFPTNDFTSSAKTITELYRKRWTVELFFKWIKQHLRIKQFWGTTENAVKIQVNCAVIAYRLVAIVAKTLKTERTIYELLQIFGKLLLNKTHVNQPINKVYCKNVKKMNDNLLLFN